MVSRLPATGIAANLARYGAGRLYCADCTGRAEVPVFCDAPAEERLLVVVAFDPGETTGWCVQRIPLNSLMEHGYREAMRKPGAAYALGQLTGGDNKVVEGMVSITREAWTLGAWSGTAGLGDHLIIAVEDFVLRMMSMDRNLLAPVRVTAAYRYALREIAAPLFLQSPGDAKSIVTDGRLQHWNVYKPGMPHARDAQRHSILAARKFCTLEKYRTQVLKMQVENAVEEDDDSDDSGE